MRAPSGSLPASEFCQQRLPLGRARRYHGALVTALRHVVLSLIPLVGMNGRSSLSPQRVPGRYGFQLQWVLSACACALGLVFAAMAGRRTRGVDQAVARSVRGLADVDRLLVRTRGRTLEIGAVLAEQERKALAGTMRQALDELKAGPGSTGMERKQ